MKHTIMFDMDDTLCHFMQPALEVVRLKAGRTLQTEELTRAMWLHDMLTRQEQEDAIPHIFNSKFYENLAPTYVVYQTLGTMWTELHDAYNFNVTTARKDALKRDALRVTEEWLRKNLVDVDSITITRPDESKVLNAPCGTKVVVEDSARVATEALQHGMVVFLIDQPWNKNLGEHPNLHRVTHRILLERMHSTLL